MAKEKTVPTRSEVEAWFVALLAGSRIRDEADRWAASWFTHPGVDAADDEVVLWALELLHGIDLTHGPEGPFLHDDEQVGHWLHEFRDRCHAP